MPGLSALKQLLLPGVKSAKGVAPIPKKPGLYHVDPSAANVETREILKRAERRAMDEGDLAERPDGGPIRMSGKQNAHGAHMLSGALNELRYAAEAGAVGKPVRGIVAVDKNGNIRAGAALNREKAGEYLSDDFDLDFTKVHPNYLEYVSTTTPDVRGSELLRLLQDEYGPDMVFQVANPKKNIPIYEAMGARRMPPRIDGGDVLGGRESLPAFRIENRIPEKTEADKYQEMIKALEAAGQERLPGFKKGGVAKYRAPKHAGMEHKASYSQMDPGFEKYFAGSERDNPPIGLEAPLLDPLDPFWYPAKAPAAAINALARLGKGYGKLAAEGVARAMESGSPLTAMAQPQYVVKQKGGNWLSGSIEDALRGLRREGYNDVNPEVDALNSWIDKQLTKYVRNEMATPEDPIRALAERGVLHFTPEAPSPNFSMRLGQAARSRQIAGTPLEGSGGSPLAQQWEALSDSTMSPRTAGEQLRAEFPHNAETMPWLEKVDPQSMVHSIERTLGGDPLNWRHLTDELSNAINPASGLPQHLQFPADRLGKVTVPQAVERVAQINAWRAAQKAEANRALAEQASMLREYTDPSLPNPKGLRWVELKKGDDLPEGWSLKPGEGEYAGYDWFFDPQGKAHNKLNDPRNKMLQDQLKYEGDTMGHCVGGYCDDVLSGRTRIMSLRDAKGEPHVTVEVAPADPFNYNNLPADIRTASNKAPRNSIESLEQYVRDYFPDRYDELVASAKPTIKQIKGKGNKKPNDEYLPFVQDFVRNNPLGGQWADVGDLQNTGLIDRLSLPGNLLKDEAPRWLTPDEVRAMGADPDKLFKNFAQGGSVSAPSWDIFS